MTRPTHLPLRATLRRRPERHAIAAALHDALCGCDDSGHDPAVIAEKSTGELADPRLTVRDLARTVTDALR